MKKLTLLLALVALGLFANAQATKYLNFGGLGTGIYVGVELPVSNVITLVPQASTSYDFNVFFLTLKGNFYFDELFGLPAEWDIYGGLNAGWRIDNHDDRYYYDNRNKHYYHREGSGFDIGAQIGARWFWSERWGLNLEFGGGTSFNSGLGVTMKL